MVWKRSVWSVTPTTFVAWRTWLDALVAGRRNLVAGSGGAGSGIGDLAVAGRGPAGLSAGMYAEWEGCGQQRSLNRRPWADTPEPTR
jgi:hypothetical protein